MSSLVLSACASSAPIAEPPETIDGMATILMSLVPEMPESPLFPSALDWNYSEELELYTLNEAGVDRILDFRDNLYGSVDTRGYLFKLEIWRLQLEAVKAKMLELGL